VAFASVGVLAVGLVALSVGFNVLLRARLRDDESAVLRTRIEAQQAELAIAGAKVRIREAPNDVALDHGAWVFAGGRVLEHPPGPSAAVQTVVDQLMHVNARTERSAGDATRLMAEPIRLRGGGPVLGTVVVGVSLVPYAHTEEIAMVGSLVLSVFLLLAGSLAVRWAVHSALRPVAEMTRRAADWSERDLHRRFAMGPPRDELTGLASTFDGLLRRIEAVVLHEQRFSAEMAHELRTPLTGVRAEAELALQRGAGDAAAREAFRHILAGTERMSSVIETLLNSARLDGGAAAGSCDPFPAAQDAVETVDAMARRRGVQLGVPAGAAGLSVDAGRALVAQALHPLLENAIRHAASRVAVEISHANGEVAIAVLDDGPGLNAEDPEGVFVPGVSSAGGAGLGLPLARRLARSCGGDVTAVPGPGGGRFELRLPGART
jgi:signal transduction histidine kinase